MFWLFGGTKKAKVSETLSPMTELELEVVPQLVLENKDGKIVVSISCQEDSGGKK